MKKRCTDCRVLKDANPDTFRLVRRYKLPAFLARCRVCENQRATERWRARNVIMKKELFREPELSWSPQSYGTNKGFTQWLTKTPTSTQIAA